MGKEGQMKEGITEPKDKLRTEKKVWHMTTNKEPMSFICKKFL